MVGAILVIALALRIYFFCVLRSEKLILPGNLKRKTEREQPRTVRFIARRRRGFLLTTHHSLLTTYRKENV